MILNYAFDDQKLFSIANGTWYLGGQGPLANGTCYIDG